MYVMKGFIEIHPFINNTPDEDALVGEISTHSKTFTKEIGLLIRTTLVLM